MALTPDPDNEFEKKGVTFKVITPDMLTQVEDFMWKNFFPDEPVSRYRMNRWGQGCKMSRNIRQVVGHGDPELDDN